MYTGTRARGVNTKEIYPVTECMSVRSWVNIHVGEEFPTPVVCIYQGQYLLRAEWELTLIQADVVFMSLPLGGGGGGGKNVMAMIGMAVVAVLAMAATWYIGGTGAFLGIEALGLGSFWGGLAGAAVMIAGSMLVNALFPTTIRNCR